MAQVIVLVSDGHSDGEIAETMGISVNTVRAHVQKILHAFSLRSRCQFWVLRKRAMSVLDGQKEA